MFSHLKNMSERTPFALAALLMAAANVAWISFAEPASADTLTVTTSKDNTLIEDAAGNRSNALGDAVYSGRTGFMGGNRRLRAVLAFDLSAIPAGSNVTAVSLQLKLMQTNSPVQTHSLYRMTADWGEGTSFAGGGAGADATPGDATWLHRFWPDSNWQTIGGDFVTTASASTTIGTAYVFYTWSSAGMVADVQGWIDNPTTNFGWMIRGNESGTRTAKKLASKDNSVEADRPILTITYTPPKPLPCDPDVTGDGTVNVNDLLAIINAWGPCADPCNQCAADIAPPDGDCIVNVNDLLACINSWGDCP